MNGKCVFITGAAGHIGQITAFNLAQKGCRVIVADKNKEVSLEVVKKLDSINGELNLFHECDLLQNDCFNKAHEFVKAQVGSLDFLVNCAAFYDDTPGWGVPFEEETIEAWEKVLRVNTIAPFFLAQKLAPLLRLKKGSAIINISSVYGVVAPDFSLYDGTAMTNPAAYGVSKGGLQQVTKWLSSALAPDIRVNTVTPGGVERGQLKVFKDRYEKRTPLQRMATENDVAKAVGFLLSDDSSYITGQNLMVDGGWTVW